jgi:hypothetical protein
MDSLSEWWSYGYDEISTKILQISATFISSPPCNIINKSLPSGKFPDRLKYSIVIPVYKKGEKDNLSNYRSISLLTTLSKIFEKVICKRLLDHFYTHNILTKSQFGFRKNVSTVNATYKLLNNILQALNNKRNCGGFLI